MFDAKNLHHAYVIEGDADDAREQVREFLQKEMKVSLTGNIDFFERIYISFGIEDAREIKENLLEKSLSKNKIFLLAIPSMTTASGNALLKALEEPSPGTHFFIIVPNSKRLLPTLLSRAVLIKFKSENSKNESLGMSPKDFLKLSSTKRIEEVKEILGLYDKEKITKQEIISFFKEVLGEYKMEKSFNSESLKNSITALDFMSDQSSSLKILMEYISLTLD